ncbi:MAG: hypothetical protein M5U28_02740 [Sandaracinaceae bacterium]|nr:hypothetical protein [Sandaracinaceae bacterium]
MAAGMATRVLKLKRDREVEARWRATKEREELAKIERRLTPRWERFATKLREESGFRADVRVGDIHEADRLVSIDPARITHPDTWRPDPKPNDVRYGWMYSDGRVVEQRAELEDTDEESAAPASDERARDGGDDDERGEKESSEDAQGGESSEADEGDAGGEEPDDSEGDEEQDDEEQAAAKAR